MAQPQLRHPHIAKKTPADHRKGCEQERLQNVTLDWQKERSGGLGTWAKNQLILDQLEVDNDKSGNMGG